jgi:hypothetical protein
MPRKPPPGLPVPKSGLLMLILVKSLFTTDTSHWAIDLSFPIPVIREDQ